MTEKTQNQEETTVTKVSERVKTNNNNNIPMSGVWYSSSNNKFYMKDTVMESNIPKPYVELTLAEYEQINKEFAKDPHNQVIEADEHGKPVVKQYMDTLGIHELKLIRRNDINRRRDKEQYEPFEYNGNFYDADTNAIMKINSVAMLGMASIFKKQPFKIEWTTYDNKEVTLNADDLVNMLGSLAKKVNIQHNIARVAKNMIETSFDRDFIQDVTWEKARTIVLNELGIESDGSLMKNEVDSVMV